MLITKIYHFSLATIGFILSPLSWWNDLVVNFPLSYIMAIPFGLINESLFIPMFIVSYWITNVIGFVMMHHGIKNLLDKAIKVEKTRRDFKNLLIISSLYTLLIALLIYFNIIVFPESFLEKIIK